MGSSSVLWYDIRACVTGRFDSRVTILYEVQDLSIVRANINNNNGTGGTHPTQKTLIFFLPFSFFVSYMYI